MSNIIIWHSVYKENMLISREISQVLTHRVLDWRATQTIDLSINAEEGKEKTLPLQSLPSK